MNADPILIFIEFVHRFLGIFQGKTIPRATRGFLAIQALGVPQVFGAPQTIDLSVKYFKSITFEKIPPTVYRNDGPILKMTVEKSSSFLLQPFLKKLKINSLTFDWKSEGHPLTRDSTHERSKEGDDAPLRIGLLTSGPEPLIPFFASAWIKAVRDHMKLPSDKMIYVAVGTKNPPGTKWESPYSSSIHVVVADDKPVENGWRRAFFQPPKDLDLVGLWIMADGDNTQAHFTTFLKDLVLSESS